MRERIKDIDRLQHIAECIDNINSYLQGYTLDSMIADKKCFHAVVYNIMIIGEAANLLTKEFRVDHSETPWRIIVDMRNVLIHGYVNTQVSYVWETYQRDLPILKQQVEGYIAELQSGSEE